MTDKSNSGPPAKITAIVRVIVSLDVEVSWVDGQITMTEAAELGREQAQSAVQECVENNMADVYSDVKLARGVQPYGTTRRVYATLVLA